MRISVFSFICRGHGLAVVVNALPSSDAKVAADILADREITSIATNHPLDTSQGLPQPFTLQVRKSNAQHGQMPPSIFPSSLANKERVFLLTRYIGRF